MFGFVRGVRGRAVVVVLVVAGLLAGVTAGSVAAGPSTTVTWKVSFLTAGQVKSLSAVATSNSSGVKTWSKTGSCTLSPTSKPTTLTMGTGASCTLTLKIAKSGEYPAKTSTKTITRKSPTTTTTVASGTTTVATGTTTVAPTTTVARTTTTTVARTTTTTGAPVVYQVGDTGPSGGIIFYKDLTRAAGSQYFEVACAGWSDETCGGDDLTDPKAEWGCYGDSISGAGGAAIGTGEQNTTDIANGCATAGIAAKRAKNLVLGGQSDWFLPSKGELNALCKWAVVDNVYELCNESMTLFYLGYGGFVNGGVYWSSSEYSPVSAFTQWFTVSWQYSLHKEDEYYIRPVRAF